MSESSLCRNVVHGGFFFLIAGSKTLVNMGQACLTVDATVLALNCLLQYHQPSVNYDKKVEVANITFQIVAAFFSTSIVVLTRYPAVWNTLTLDKLKSTSSKFHNAFSDSSKKAKATLAGIALLGLLSCFARGISAYLGIEVIIGDRLGIGKMPVVVMAWIAAFTVTVSSICFNLSKSSTSEEIMAFMAPLSLI